MSVGRQEVTAREAAVLAVIGRRLTNPEIAAEFHLSVRTVESHIAALRRKLGVDSRTALIEQAAIRSGIAVVKPANSFVGRDSELIAVGSLLDERRLITLTGPGGSGKTRLALEVAARADRPTTLVGFENVAGRDIAAEIGRRVGVGPGGGDLTAACALALSRHPCLLLLDNCDQVTADLAAVVSQLLASCPDLRVLATSRSALGCSDEAVYSLAPLSAADAATLLAHRTRAAVPDAAGLDDDLAKRICARLDGLPLAIELAAVRLRHLSPPELDRELARSLATLDRGGSGEPRTLTATFTSSFEQLTDGERDLAMRLAALPGPFDLDLAESVGGAGAAAAVLRLLDRSFVIPAPSDTKAGSFRILEVMRELVLARTPDQVAADARYRHAQHIARRVSTLAAAARTDDSPRAVAEFGQLVPGAIAALRWALDTGNVIALPLARDLAVAAEQYGPSAGLLDALGRVAGNAQVLDHADAGTLLDLGLAICYGNLELADDLTRRGLQLDANDDGSVSAARLLAGMSDAYRNRPESALHHLGIAEEAARRLDDHWLHAAVRQARGLAMRRIEPIAAIDEFRAALELFALAGDAMHVNNARFMMADTAAEAGFDLHRAAAWARQCVSYAESVGNRHELAHAILTLAQLTTRTDVLPRAVAIFEAVGDLRCLTRCHVLFAHLGHDQVGNLERAYDVATRAHDANRRARVLEQLVRVHAEAGRLREAALALGALTALVGDEQALASVPKGLSLDDWGLVMEEGRAHAAGPR